MAVVEQETLLKTDFAECQLHRYPSIKKDTLRAWDAADVYILHHLAEQNLLIAGSSLFVLNDSFGALSICLSRFHPVVMTDSYLSTQAVFSNAQTNNIDESLLTIINSLDSPEEFMQQPADVVLIKLPKSLAILEDQLHRIRCVLKPATQIIAAGMTKNIHMSTMALFEKIIGPTKTSLARKKSRLIFSQQDAGLTPGNNPYPGTYKLPYKLDDVDIEISNHAAVFSQEKLDIGSRFFIENIPDDDRYKTIVDLGCGNGVVGLLAALKNPQAKLIFSDESYMAVETSINNFTAMFGESRDAEFLQTDCLQGIEEGSVSLILCNPPFHQNNAISDTIAWQMFLESKAALQENGELIVIGNRHLAYHAKLKRLFGNCENVASNKKFVILKAKKTSNKDQAEDDESK